MSAFICRPVSLGLIRKITMKKSTSDITSASHVQAMNVKKKEAIIPFVCFLNNASYALDSSGREHTRTSSVLEEVLEKGFT